MYESWAWREEGEDHVGEEAHHELGVSDIHSKKKKKTSSVNGISKYLLLCSRPVPQGDIWRKEKKKGK